mmetsp:Transcript_21432/g.35091  ORF Transcript_21432/g.35091 Transcript_21432/m.35091 type:complete len:130 (-) Transcript_21432:1117-1506(-)
MPELRFAENDPDRHAFAKHFSACLDNTEKDTVCSFSNRRGDALLVSPLSLTNVDDSIYSHLALFVRKAPKSQVAEFRRLSAFQYLEVIKQKYDQLGVDAKTWFSTHGMGVSWLHFRLDSRPKYYSYRPF